MDELLLRTWEECCQLEGRLQEWVARVGERMEMTGESRSEASAVVSAEMGCVDLVQVRERLRKLRMQKQSEPAPISSAEKIERVIRSLVPSADRVAEWEWVSCHPAMSRRFSQRDETKRVFVTTGDILRPAHGKCPSMRAANLLLSSVDNPVKFFEKYRETVQKMDGEKSADQDYVHDPTADVVERMLKESLEGV